MYEGEGRRRLQKEVKCSSVCVWKFMLDCTWRKHLLSSHFLLKWVHKACQISTAHREIICFCNYFLFLPFHCCILSRFYLIDSNGLLSAFEVIGPFSHFKLIKGNFYPDFSNNAHASISHFFITLRPVSVSFSDSFILFPERCSTQLDSGNSN